MCFQLESKEDSFAIGTIDSTELCNSDAPLLLSIKDQRRLQLQVNLGDENTPDKVYSRLLGGYLKVTDLNGLLGLHLLPSQIAMLGMHSSQEQTVTDTDVETDYGSEEPSSPTSPASSTTTNTEVHLRLDEEQPKTLTKNQKRQLEEELNELGEQDQAMWSQLQSTPRRGRRSGVCLPRGCKVFLLEIFAGAALLSSIAANQGLPVAAPVDITLDGSDLLKASVRQELDHEIDRLDPYVITFSPVCGPWGPWSKLNMSKNEVTREKILRDRDSWFPFTKWLRGLVRRRLAKGRKVLIENPWTSEFWDSFHMKKLMEEHLYDSESLQQLELVRCDQCMFGLRDHFNGELHYKPTGFLTASQEVKEYLNVRCDRSHQHQHLEGGQRTKRAQEWPTQLCQAMLDGFIAELEHRNLSAAFHLESVDEGRMEEDLHLGVLDTIQDERDLAPQQDLLPDHLSPDELQRQEQLEESPLAADQEMELERDRRHKWLKLPRPTRLALRRLHTMTGHSSPASMVQLLRTANAAPAVIEGCRSFACEACRKRQPLERPNVTKMPNRYTFNHEVSLDCLEIKDKAGNRHTILSAVDIGTLYHQCWWVAGGGVPKSSVCAEAFIHGWIAPFGPPQSVVCDKGMHNQGRMRDMLRIHGISIRYTGLEAPYQLGRGERQGGIFKELMYAAMEERNIIGTNNIKTLISETCGVKNMRVNHQGFTPYQWVLGKLPVDETSLTSEEAEGRFLSVQEEVEESEDTFALRLQIRQAAKMAFSKVDSSRRIRSALLRKSTPIRTNYVPGNLVCFHREAARGLPAAEKLRTGHREAARGRKAFEGGPKCLNVAFGSLPRRGQGCGEALGSV